MSDWERLAEHVINRRVELGYKRRPAFVAASGISLRTLSDIETHRKTSYDRGTLATLEHALNWAAGSVHAILVGGKPAERAPSTPERPATAPAGSNDEALVRVMSDPRISDRDKMRIARLLIEERERFEQERMARAEALIRAFDTDER